MRRKILKFIGASFLTFFLFPFKIVNSKNIKIINKNLTEKQKNILFNEGTERPFTSSLLHEKRNINNMNERAFKRDILSKYSIAGKK